MKKLLAAALLPAIAFCQPALGQSAKMKSRVGSCQQPTGNWISLETVVRASAACPASVYAGKRGSQKVSPGRRPDGGWVLWMKGGGCLGDFYNRTCTLSAECPGGDTFKLTFRGEKVSGTAGGAGGGCSYTLSVTGNAIY